MKQLIGKILCALPRWAGGGHRRGEFVKRVGIGADGKTDTVVYQCPRCHATWTRKVKAKVAG